MANVTVNRRLFLTADKDRLVDPGDPAAAYLWATPGDEVSPEEAERVGYALAAETAPSEDDEKSDAPEGDKAVASPDEDKAAKPPTRRGKA